MDHDLQSLQSELASALSGLDARQTQATPPERPDKWSIQQIVEHLLLSYASTLNVVRTRLDKRSPTRARPSLRQRIGQFFLITLGRFPYGRKSPMEVSPSVPSTLRSGPELAERIAVELAALDRLCAQAEPLFGHRRAVSHMVLGPLSIAQWRRFHLIHGRHHIHQILAIRRQHALE